MSLCGSSPLCSEFSPLLICHIVLVGFLHTTIRIKAISLQVCLDLSADSGCGFFTHLQGSDQLIMIELFSSAQLILVKGRYTIMLEQN